MFNFSSMEALDTEEIKEEIRLELSELVKDIEDVGVEKEDDKLLIVDNRPEQEFWVPGRVIMMGNVDVSAIKAQEIENKVSEIVENY